jgi:hypothetical protein
MRWAATYSPGENTSFEHNIHWLKWWNAYPRHTIRPGSYFTIS